MTWEIEISDARGAWACKGFRAPRPGIYTTDDQYVAEEASGREHIYVRELVEDEAVEDEGPDEKPESEGGTLTLQDLRKPAVVKQTCEICGRQYKYSHKRCPGPPDDEANEEPEPEPEPEVEAEVTISPIVPEE